MSRRSEPPRPDGSAAARLLPPVMVAALGVFLQLRFDPAATIGDIAVAAATVVALGSLRGGPGRSRLIAAAVVAAILLGAVASETAGVLPAAVLLGLTGRLAARLFRRQIDRPAAVAPEALRWTALAVFALANLWAYTSPRLVGGGDALFYAQQTADFAAQMRAGIFPVMVGQSEFAPTGDFHTHRTAPLWGHLTGAVHIVTGQRLGPAGAQNLVLVLAHLAAVLACYLLVALVIPGQRWLAALLAAFWALMPAVLAPLVAGDMFGTWLALVPALAMCAAVALLVRQVSLDTVLRLAVPAAGVALWIHAPLAATLLALLGAGFVARWLLEPANCRGELLPAAGAGVLVLLLGAYVFVSVDSLGLPPLVPARLDGLRDAMAASAAGTWRTLLSAVSANGDRLMEDMKPGFSWLIVSLIAAVAAVRQRRWDGLALGGLVAAGFLMLSPLAGVVWRLVPGGVLQGLGQWPAQRVVPVLACLIPFAVALSLRGLTFDRRFRLEALLLVAAVVGLALHQARPFWLRARAVTHTAEATWRALLPENLAPSRYSFEMAGGLPRHWSPVAQKPAMQIRLLDHRMDPVDSNRRAVRRDLSTVDFVSEHRWTPTDFGGRFLPDIQLRENRRYLVTAEFGAEVEEGWLVLEGRRLRREYRLPAGGGERTFGHGKGRPDSFALWLTDPQADTIRVHFSADRHAAGAPPSVRSLQVSAYRPELLPFQIDDLVPMRLQVRSSRSGWVEVFKMHLEGYRVRVNGQEVGSHASPDGLLMFPLEQGVSLVDIEYPGPRRLRIAFWFSLAVGTLGLVASRVELRGDASLGIVPLARTAAILALAAGSVAGGVIASSRMGAPPPGNRVDFTVYLPHPDPVGCEPLAVVGEAGRGYLCYVRYVDGQHVRLGVDVWGVGILESETLPLNYRSAHRIGFQVEPAGRESRVVIELDGRRVVERSGPWPAADFARLHLGSNPLGGSVVAPEFRGAVMRIPTRRA